MRRALVLLASALISFGCVYEFTPEIDPVDSVGLVVEGDIVIGDVSTFTLTAVEPLSSPLSARTPLNGKAWVEDDQGNQYLPEKSGSASSFSIDMTGAPLDREYRLRVILDTPITAGTGSYSSEFKPVQQAPSIDELTYTYDNSDMHLWLSLSSPGGSGCFRWDYEEIWEYHADSLASYYFDVTDGRVKSYDGAIPPLYWCWMYKNSTQAGLAIAKSTGGERISGYKFLDFGRMEKRTQKLYYIKLKARGISEECYEYLHAIEVNSTSTGSLTQPDPSRIVGNIRSDDNPLEVVYGYIEVAKMATRSMYIDDKYVFIPQPKAGGDVHPPEPISGPITYWELYEGGSRPFNAPNVWLSYKCVECTAEGGVKIKPDFWPTDTE